MNWGVIYVGRAGKNIHAENAYSSSFTDFLNV